MNWDSTRKEALDIANLAQFGRDDGLHECIVFNGGTVFSSDKMVADAVKAILGAVHQDGGEAALARVMGQLGLGLH